jgi:hypothetical protein
LTTALIVDFGDGTRVLCSTTRDDRLYWKLGIEMCNNAKQEHPI